MIWLLVFAQSSAPNSTNLRSWLSADDTPVAIMPGNVLKSVKTALTIDPEGKLQDCAVEVSSGIPKLDTHTCKVLSRRAKFRPALDGNGMPIYGVYRTQIDWWVGDGYPPKRQQIPDMVLKVSALSPKSKSPVLLTLGFRVDESGHPSECWYDGKKEDPTLVRLGCDQLIKSYTAKPARTPAGTAVPSVQTAMVRFELEGVGD